MKKMNKKGFTIVELVIVIAVIAILAAVLVPTFSNVISNAKDSAALSNAQAAYKEYYAGLEADELDSAANDFVYNKDGRYVVIKDGKVVDTIYESNDAALAAQFPENTTEDIDSEIEGVQYVGYDVSNTAVDGVDNLYEVTASTKTVFND